jgi:acyl-CoA synthetase (AMP-forming)/AMP-acid ligase II
VNIPALIEWSADRYADRIAFVYGDLERTFRQVDDRANSLANALLTLGLARGDRVGVLVSNRPEYPETEFAISKAGGVRVPMLESSSAEEVRHYIEFSGTRIVVASEPGLTRLRSLRPRLGSELIVIAVGEVGPDELAYEQVIEGGSKRRPGLNLVEDDLHALRFSGGTTGKPKGILMDHRCMVNVINNHLLNLEITPDEVVCHFHPLSHAAGKLMWTWWQRGCRQVILPAFGFRPEVLLETIERERVTTMFMIPTALTRVLDSGALDRYDISSLRRIIYGGAPIAPHRIEQALNAFGPVLTQIYGLTESPNALTLLLPEDHRFSGDPPERLKSAGRPIYNVEVRVVDGERRNCAVGEVGEVISRGPHTMRGYWRDEARTRERMIDGWVYHGDMGRFDADGYLYIVDRKDDLVITGGFNVWPTEVEAVLGAHPAVSEAAVFGVQDDTWGEALNAAVVLKRPGGTGEEDLRGYVRERLASYKVPKRIFITEDPLPKSGVGKILRRRVRERLVPDAEATRADSSTQA